MAKDSRKARGTGSIYQKNAAYVAQVQDGFRENGKPKYRQAQRKTHAEAVKALNELMAKVTTGIAIPDGKAPNLAAWLDTWLEDHVKPNLEPKSYDFYKLNVEKRIKPNLGRFDLRKVKPADVNSMFRKIEAEGASKSTIAATKRTLRAAFGVAVKMELCASNPVTNSMTIKVRTKPKVYFDREDVQKLTDALVGSPIQNLVVFTMATGLRVGEATGLTWDCIDFTREIFRVENQLQRVDKELILKPLKTDRSRREMALFGDSLTAVQTEQERHAKRGYDNPLNIVFLNPFGRPFDQKYVDEKLKEVLEKAGLPATGMHSLRHSAATFLLMKGFNLHQVSVYLGHSQIALTSNLYGHVLSEGQKDAAKALQEAYK